MSASNVCPPPMRSRPYQPGPTIYYMTIKKIALGGAKGDILVQLPSPCNTFFVASIDNAHQTDSLFWHQFPLGKQYSGNGIVEVGNEQWISLKSLNPGQPNSFGMLRFSQLVTQFYLDIGHEAAGTDYFLTLACMNDTDTSVTLIGGRYT